MCLSGKPVAQSLQLQISAEVENCRRQGVIPRMVTLLVEGDPASRIYAEQKVRVAKRIGIVNEILQFPANVSTHQLCRTIREYTEDPGIHGIMVELPLPRHVSQKDVIEAIDPRKDVDGLTRMSNPMCDSAAQYPATPVACIRLLKHYGFTLAGKDVALIGFGKTVGMPLFHLLVEEQATVTVCHVGTRSLAKHLKHADIAFVAVGKAGLISPEMVHSDLVIVDAGINEAVDGGITGDVRPDVARCVTAMTPTPGGVGSVTTLQLFANLLQAVELQIVSERMTVGAL